MSTDSNVVPLRVYVTPQEAAAQEQQLRHAQQLADAVLLLDELVTARRDNLKLVNVPRRQLDLVVRAARIVKGQE